MEEIFLYILCRQDIGSMANIAGLLAAQVAHSANQCVYEAGTPAEVNLVREWEEQTGDGFGTTITLSVEGRTLADKIALAKLHKIHAGITHDPTFPVRDGDVTHLVPVDTCGYVFGRKKDCIKIVCDLGLVG